MGAKQHYFMNTKAEILVFFFKFNNLFSQNHSAPFTFLNKVLSSEFNVVNEFKLFRNIH